MKHNFDAKFLLETFFTMVETQFHCKIKSLRSDNAPEFELKTFLAPQGTLHQHSCVGTPQRKHQHLLAVARALKFESNIPIHFWVDCDLTSVPLINRSPSPLLNNRSPYEPLFQPSHPTLI